jgi:DNA-binding NarL/FixJ family response regulator
MTRTVLIVDDHPAFRASARTMLEDEGFAVVGEAEDGRTALHYAVIRENPDVVIVMCGCRRHRPTRGRERRSRSATAIPTVVRLVGYYRYSVVIKEKSHWRACQRVSARSSR